MSFESVPKHVLGNTVFSESGNLVGECGLEFYNERAQRVSSVTLNAEPVSYEPRKAPANNSEKPKICVAEVNTEGVHPSIWILVMWARI